MAAGLWAVSAEAQDAIWLANPATNIFNTATNWSSGTVPTIARDGVLLDAGLDPQLTRRVRLGNAYVGQPAGNVADHSTNGRLRWVF